MSHWRSRVAPEGPRSAGGAATRAGGGGDPAAGAGDAAAGGAGSAAGGGRASAGRGRGPSCRRCRGRRGRRRRLGSEEGRGLAEDCVRVVDGPLDGNGDGRLAGETLTVAHLDVR